MISRRSLFQTLLSTPLLAVPPAEEFVRINPRDRRYFELSSGDPFIPIGLNIALVPSEDARRAMDTMAEWLSALGANGGNFVRVWIGSPFWDVEHAASGEYDPVRAERIDWLFEQCRKNRIRAKLTIDHFRTFDGSVEWSRKPMHQISNAGPAANIADFFDGERSRAQFRHKLAWLAARYGNRPEIFGWELWNEVDCVGGGDYAAWTELMLAELHRVFPRNLAMQSLGSFDREDKRPRYRRFTKMTEADLAQVHRYLDLGAAMEICHGPVDMLTSDAVRELLAWKPDKPVLLAESGAVVPKHSGPFPLYPKDHDGIILHDVLFAPFFAGAAGTGQIWHWDHYVAPNNLWRHFGRFAEAVKGVDPPAEGFTPAMIPHERLRVYALRGRRTFLAWCRDTQNNWKSELANGEKPELLRDIAVNIGLAGSAAVRIYNPWSNQWSAGRLAGGVVKLPEFTRSIVISATMA